MFPAMERLRSTMLLLERANRTASKYGFSQMGTRTVGALASGATEHQQALVGRDSSRTQQSADKTMKPQNEQF